MDWLVRGEQLAESDVDLLVTFTETPTLYEFVNLKRHLEEVLDREVDQVTVHNDRTRVTTPRCGV